MILQALTKLYEDLAEQGKIAREGWNAVKISYLLEIDEDGTLLGFIPQFKEIISGKKTQSVPMDRILPAAVKRSSGIASNFLWDNSAYMLGIDGKGKPERAKECFEACKGFHRELLDGIDTAAARAILNFFDGWEPASAAEHPLIVENLNEMVFVAACNSVGRRYLHRIDFSDICAAIFRGKLDILGTLWHIIFRRGISTSSVLTFACSRVFFCLNLDGLQIQDII